MIPENSTYILDTQKLYLDWHYTCKENTGTKYQLDTTLTYFFYHAVQFSQNNVRLWKIIVRESGKPFWFFEEADPDSFSKCQQRFQSGLKVTMIIWPKTHEDQPVIYVSKIVFHHIPVRIQFTIDYSDATCGSYHASDPQTIYETLKLLKDASGDMEVKTTLSSDIMSMCITCGKQATGTCLSCNHNICFKCGHGHG
jgi:hypothetical protein